MVRHRLALALLLAALPVGAAVAADDPGVTRLDLVVGGDAPISGGPIREFLCDDGSLVKLEFTPEGVAMKGLKAGTTLCSYRDVTSMRRVVRVTVRDRTSGGGASGDTARSGGP